MRMFCSYIADSVSVLLLVVALDRMENRGRADFNSQGDGALLVTLFVCPLEVVGLRSWRGVRKDWRAWGVGGSLSMGALAIPSLRKR